MTWKPLHFDFEAKPILTLYFVKVSCEFKPLHTVDPTLQLLFGLRQSLTKIELPHKCFFSRKILTFVFFAKGDIVNRSHFAAEVL